MKADELTVRLVVIRNSCLRAEAIAAADQVDILIRDVRVEEMKRKLPDPETAYARIEKRQIRALKKQGKKFDAWVKKIKKGAAKKKMKD